MVEKGRGDWFSSSTFLPPIPVFAPLLLKFSFNGDSDDVTSGNNYSNNKNSEPGVNLIKLLQV